MRMFSQVREFLIWLLQSAFEKKLQVTRVCSNHIRTEIGKVVNASLDFAVLATDPPFLLLIFLGQFSERKLPLFFLAFAKVLIRILKRIAPHDLLLARLALVGGLSC